MILIWLRWYKMIGHHIRIISYVSYENHIILIWESYKKGIISESYDYFINNHIFLYDALIICFSYQYDMILIWYLYDALFYHLISAQSYKNHIILIWELYVEKSLCPLKTIATVHFLEGPCQKRNHNSTVVCVIHCLVNEWQGMKKS